jgi:hypothetical protein
MEAKLNNFTIMSSMLSADSLRQSSLSQRFAEHAILEEHPVQNEVTR